MKPKSKVFVFGMDGATFDLILPWVEAGHLPHFARLLNEGSWGYLASAPNMRSPAAWSSFITGMNPGKHGLYEFYEPIPQTYQVRFVHGGMRRGPSLWRLLSDAGKRVGVINVPMTYPAESVNGFVIAGLDAPGVESQGFCHPPGIRQELQREFGTYILEPGLTGCLVSGHPELGVEKLREELVQKERVTAYFLERYPWDFFVVVFRSLDAVQHCYWKYMDPLHPQHAPEEGRRFGSVILDAYRQLDASLGRIRAMLDDETTLIVMSDHGFGRKHAASSQLNRWLAARGYLRFAEERRSLSSLRGRIRSAIYKAVIARTSRRTKESLARWLPRLRNRLQSQMCYARIDWSRTQVFADGLFPALRINQRDREPLGIVSSGNEYQQLVAQLKSELAECRDVVTGRPIVDRVFHREEIYTGPCTDKAPDLLIRWREDEVIHGLDMAAAAPAPEVHENVAVPGEDPKIISGDHKFWGVFLMAGKGVRRATEIQGPRLIDLAPTVLSRFGLAVPPEMDGRVLTEAFETQAGPTVADTTLDSSPHEHHNTGGPTDYSAEEQEMIADRLRNLGYLE